MKSKLPYIIAGTASLIALASLASAWSISSKNKASEAEILSLQHQIAQMGAYVPEIQASPEIIYLTNDGDTNELALLKIQLAEQEALLAEFQTSTNQQESEPRPSFEERMAQMKEEDPEGYAEMIQRREERQNEMRYNLAERTATFMDLDTSMMNEKELANHELLVTKMARVWELTEQFQDPEAAPDREAMRELYSEINEVRPLMKTERNVMFKQLGAELGYEGKDAKNFAGHVQDIIDATTVQMPRGGRRGGGR